MLPMEKEFKDVLKAQAMEAKGPPPVVVWDASTRFVNEAIQKVVLTGVGPEKALAQAAKSMNNELKKER